MAPQLSAVVTIFNLATTANLSTSALFEAQFTSAGVATTVGVPLTQIMTTIAPFLAPPQRAIASSGGLPVTSADEILNFNISTSLSVSVPLASARSGVPVIFADAGLTFSTNNLTLNRSGSDTFSGATTIVMSVDGQRLTLIPFNDGVNSGYSVG